MAPRAKFDQLPEELRREIGQLWLSKKHSLDEILAHLRKLAGKDVDISRTGLYRGLEDFAKVSAQMKRANDYTAFMLEKFGGDKESELMRGLAQLLKTTAFNTLMDLAEAQGASHGAEPGGEDGPLPPKPGDLMMMGKMLDHIARAERVNLDTRAKIRDEVAKEAAKALERGADKAQKSGRRIDPETLRLIREEIYGITRPAASP